MLLSNWACVRRPEGNTWHTDVAQLHFPSSVWRPPEHRAPLRAARSTSSAGRMTFRSSPRQKAATPSPPSGQPRSSGPTPSRAHRDRRRTVRVRDTRSAYSRMACAVSTSPAASRTWAHHGRRCPSNAVASGAVAACSLAGLRRRQLRQQPPAPPRPLGNQHRTTETTKTSPKASTRSVASATCGRSTASANEGWPGIALPASARQPKSNGGASAALAIAHAQSTAGPPTAAAPSWGPPGSARYMAADHNCKDSAPSSAAGSIAESQHRVLACRVRFASPEDPLPHCWPALFGSERRKSCAKRSSATSPSARAARPQPTVAGAGHIPPSSISRCIGRRTRRAWQGHSPATSGART
mmetsp:Transcript_96054/g.266858  ORF Transcript_96054/g.266858 Transcript_96054/m.266858 type:complete len:355 (+) Transcript_96054:2243-3307(+)